jgi:hypothetical protein
MLTMEQWPARFGSGGLQYESFRMDEVAARFYRGAATNMGVTARAADVWTVYDLSEENLMSFPRVKKSLLSGSTFWWMFLHPISQYHRR